MQEPPVRKLEVMSTSHSESTRNLPSLHPPGLRPDRPIPCFRFRSPSPSEVPAPARHCLPMLGPCHACQEFPIELPTRHSNNPQGVEPQNCTPAIHPPLQSLGCKAKKSQGILQDQPLKIRRHPRVKAHLCTSCFSCMSHGQV